MSIQRPIGFCAEHTFVEHIIAQKMAALQKKHL